MMAESKTATRITIGKIYKTLSDARETEDYLEICLKGSGDILLTHDEVDNIITLLSELRFIVENAEC